MKKKTLIIVMFIFLTTYILLAQIIHTEQKHGINLSKFSYADIPQAILSDYRVNDDISSSTRQSEPDIAMDSEGNFIVTWSDARSGNNDIYVQRFNVYRKALTKNIIINDDEGSTSQYEPSIAMASSGNYVITWTDNRNGSEDIYAQRFDALGNALGTNILINDDEGSSDQYTPSIAMNDQGKYVITWVDERNGIKDIYAQRFDASCKALGANVIINNNEYNGEGDYDQTVPSIAMDSNGDYVITWRGSDIYFQQYNTYGKALRSNTLVNSHSARPSIAMDNYGNFVITWSDRRSSMYDVYAQRFNSMGNVLGGNILINDDEGYTEQKDPSIAMDSNGNYVIVWSDGRSRITPDIYAQRFNNAGNTLGDNFIINDYKRNANKYASSIAINDNGHYVIAWLDNRNGNYDIYAQQLNSPESALGENFIVNDDHSNSSHVSPSIALDSGGNFAITWEDWRYTRGDIFVQRFDASGNPIAKNKSINGNEYSLAQTNPSIAMNSIGEYTITWSDNYGVYANRFDKSGNLLYPVLTLNYTYAYNNAPSITMNGVGDKIITWTDRQTGNCDIYALQMDTTGYSLKPGYIIIDDENDSSQTSPSTAMDSNGNFVITWKDERNGNSDIYAQRFDSLGNILGDQVIINDDEESAIQSNPSTAMDSNGNYVITWEDERNGNYDIYAQRFDALGNALGNNVIINDDEGSASQTSPSIAMDCCGNYVIAWEDERYGHQVICAQRFDNFGNTLGNNLPINSTYTDYSTTCKDPSIKLRDSKLYVTWSEIRIPERDYDIFCKIIGFNQSDVLPVLKDYTILKNNYPNPFNPSTTIEYHLPNDSHVELTILDIKGKKLNTLVNSYHKAGVHRVVWNASNLTSGLYFYRLNTGDFMETQKMLLMK